MNGSLLAAIDTETTGLSDSHNELIQLAVLPLDANCDPMLEPFDCYSKPKYLERFDAGARRVNKISDETLCAAPDPEDAQELFDNWFEKVVLENGFKKIVPLGQNLQFDSGFIRKWFGYGSDGVSFADDYFEFYKARDTKRIAEYFNDLAYFINDDYPFPKTSLTYLANRFQIKTEGAHDALNDCYTTAKVYKALLGYKTHMIDFA